ncbi:MAG: hypothetical protein AABY86_12490, partial [Bdellovibrionota bacterium]
TASGISGPGSDRCPALCHSLEFQRNEYVNTERNEEIIRPRFILGLIISFYFLKETERKRHDCG